MKTKNVSKENIVTCIFDETAEPINELILKIFEYYLEKTSQELEYNK